VKKQEDHNAWVAGANVQRTPALIVSLFLPSVGVCSSTKQALDNVVRIPSCMPQQLICHVLRPSEIGFPANIAENVRPVGNSHSRKKIGVYAWTVWGRDSRYQP
jgi:hypothetical protein